jgi:hypothetical protein
MPIGLPVVVATTAVAGGIIGTTAIPGSSSCKFDWTKEKCEYEI